MLTPFQLLARLLFGAGTLCFLMARALERNKAGFRIFAQGLYRGMLLDTIVCTCEAPLLTHTRLTQVCMQCGFTHYGKLP